MTRRTRRTLLCITAMLAAPSARAEDETRVVTVSADGELSHAIELALAAWHAQVVPVAAPTPDSDVHAAILTAHRLARASNALAVVWISPGSPSLWIYDERTHQITVRPLSAAPPYDEATSAAVALTVKTVLSATQTKATASGDATKPVAEARAPSSPPAKHTVRAYAYAGARSPTNVADSVAARFGLEATYFPAWLHPYLGVTLGLYVGPALAVERPPLFSGVLTDVTTSLKVAGRLPMRRWLAGELALGPGIHVGTVEGNAGGASGRLVRVDPSLEVSIGLEFAWGDLRVGPLFSADSLLRFQRYNVGGTPVVDVPSVQVEGGLRLGMELP